MSNENVTIDICICTFKRPQIEDTFKSIVAQELDPSFSLRVIVADNDETPDAQSDIETWGKDLGLDLLYVHAPARNISIARNACLDHVTADIAVFIDDDETANPEWLSSLYATWKETKPSAVLGPVHAIYGQDAPAWMVTEDFHSIYPVWVNDEIITGYTSNVLLDFSCDVVRNLRFRLELGQSGGEDSAYFASLHQAGKKIAYSKTAILNEIVPPTRARFSWLAKRRYRMGQTHAMMMLENGEGRAKGFIKAMAKITYCLAFGLLNIFRRGRMAFWILRGMLHVGVISRLFGQKNLKLYG